MAKVKTAELIGAALDWAVAKCEGHNPVLNMESHGSIWHGWYERTPKPDPRYRRLQAYSTDWAQAGPLLNQHKISRTIDHSGLWIAYAGYNLNDEQRHMQCDRSELVAGLRCLVALNLGEVVDVPEELL